MLRVCCVGAGFALWGSVRRLGPRQAVIGLVPLPPRGALASLSARASAPRGRKRRPGQITI